MSTEQVITVAPGIQAGTINKTQGGTLRVNFFKPFSGIPVVVLTPFFPGGPPVHGVETLVEVTRDNFTINSGNNHSNYFVNWIAVGSFQ